MIRIKEAIIVEGKYDKIKLSQIVDTTIICSDGFRIYHNSQMFEFLKTLAQTTGVIILTDSDSAGFRIRNFIKNKLGAFSVKHAFIPDIYGKESRKEKASKEGKLGVEGMEDEVISHALVACGATFLEKSEHKDKSAKQITKLDLYRLGFSGKKESKTKRTELLKKLSLPEKMSANMMVDVINTMLSYHLMEETLYEIFFK